MGTRALFVSEVNNTQDTIRRDKSETDTVRGTPVAVQYSQWRGRSPEETINHAN